MAKKKTATKKPAAKKKPAETPLLKAAKRVIQEIQVGQIDPGCNAGEDALAELLGLCGCPCSHHEASLQVHMDQCPVPINDDTKIVVTVTADGKPVKVTAVEVSDYSCVSFK